MQEEVKEYSSGNVLLHKCVDCGRKFNEKALDRHIKICKKVFVEKRKEFNSKNARMTEEQLKIENNNEDYIFKKQTKKSKKPVDNQAFSLEEKPLKKIPKWKLQSQMFRKAMNSNTDTQVG